MDLDQFRLKFPERREHVAGLTWGVIETAPPPGAPVLAMLPGTLGTAQIFWNQIAALADDVRIISVTYPIVDDLVRLAEGLAQLFDALGIERGSVLGSSLGGYLAQKFAALYPERVDQIFIGNSLCDPYIANPNRPPAQELRALPPEKHREIVLGSVAGWREPEPIFTELKRILVESGSELISAEALKARVLAVAGGGEIPELEIPDERIVIIDCEDDPLLAAPARDDVVRRYPGAELLRLPVGGHYPYITRPEAYTALIRRRLQV
jgi:pimeloyl-ACP methyl ester carboxylesterase